MSFNLSNKPKKKHANTVKIENINDDLLESSLEHSLVEEFAKTEIST